MKRNKIIWQTALALLQTLTGAALMVFLAGHLLGISTINFGEGWFNSYASYLDHTNTLVKVLIWLVIIALLIHGLNGLRIVWRYFKKTPAVHGYLINTKYRDSFLWYIHFATGIVIGITLIFHLAVAYFGTPESITTAEMVKARLQNDWYFAIMILLLVSVIFHACCGVRNILVKYGLLIKYHKVIFVALLIIGVAATILGINNLLLFGGGK